MTLQHRNLGFDAQVREDLPHTVVIALDGPLDSTTAPSLLDGLLPLRNAGILRYLLDLKTVPHLTSICDGVLIHLAYEMRPRGGCVIIANVPPRIRVLLEMLGWGKHLELADTVEDALRLVRKCVPSE